MFTKRFNHPVTGLLWKSRKSNNCVNNDPKRACYAKRYSDILSLRYHVLLEYFLRLRNAPKPLKFNLDKYVTIYANCYLGADFGAKND